MVHLILTGATGLVGSGVLHHILSLTPAAASAQNLTRVSILSRRKEIPLLNHPDRPQSNTVTKVEVIQHEDFTKYGDEILGKLKDGQDDKVGVIWALGKSTTQVKSEEEYDQITRVYTMEAAKAFSAALQQSTTSDTPGDTKTSSQLNFIYISGDGVTQNPGRLTPLFSRVKGKTELELQALSQTAPYSSNFRYYIMRPAGVDGYNQSAVWSEALKADVRKNLVYKLVNSVALPVLRTGVVFKNFLSPTEEIGKVAVDLATGDGGKLSGTGVEDPEGRIVTKVGLRRMAQEQKLS